MYTLLSGLYKYMFQKDEYCILILGLDNAGKTVRAVPCQHPYSPAAPWSCWFYAFSCMFCTHTGSELRLRPWDSYR